MNYSKPFNIPSLPRLAPPPDWLVLALSSVLLVVSIVSIHLDHTLPVLPYVASFALMGLSNLALALVSVLPEDRGGRAAGEALAPLVILMGVALGAMLMLLALS